MMTREEFAKEFQKFNNKLSIWKVALNEKKIIPYTYGYFFDNSSNMWIVYDVGERNDIGVLAECKSEGEALEKLYIVVRLAFRTTNGRN